MIRTGSITSPGRTGTSPRPSSTGRAAGRTRSTRPVRPKLAKSGRRGRAEYGSRCPAGRSAICSFALGMAGQVVYHLLAQAGITRAPWAVTTLVSCLPILVLAMGTALAHMQRADATADRPGTETSGPATSRSPRLVPPGPRRPPPGPKGRGPYPVLHPGPEPPRGGAKMPPQEQGTGSGGDRPGPPDRRKADSSGEAGVTASLAQRRNQRLQRGPERPGAHDQRRAGRHRIPARTWRSLGVIPRLRCSITAPAPVPSRRGYGRCRRPEPQGERQTASR